MHCTNSTQVTCKQKKIHILRFEEQILTRQYVNTPPTLTVTQVDLTKFPQIHLSDSDQTNHCLLTE